MAEPDSSKPGDGGAAGAGAGAGEAAPGGKSKNALKRERKEEQMAQVKRMKKAQEKERKKARKALFRQLAGAGADAPPPAAADAAGTDAAGAAPARPRHEVKGDRKAEYLAKCQSNFSVIVDCAWDSHLVGRPLKSLAQQILFCYGLNRRADNPCGLYLTGVNPKLREQLEKSSLSNWVGVLATPDDYLSLPAFSIGGTAAGAAVPGAAAPGAAAPGAAAPGAAAAAAADPDAAPEAVPPARVQHLVYLTSDAEETLTTLEPDTAYIIGGIVDRNSLKGATALKAQSQGVRAAKLPIKEHVAMAATHVLTVNHVFELLLHYQRCGSWGDAIAAVLPQRKGATLRGGGEEEGGDEEEEGGDERDEKEAKDE